MRKANKFFVLTLLSVLLIGFYSCSTETKQDCEINKYCTIEITNTSTNPYNIYIDNISVSVTSGLENLILNNLNLNVAPNPFSSNTKVMFNLLFTANVTADLYDVFGRKVVNVFDGKLNSGRQELSIDSEYTATLKSGVYLLRLSVDGVVKTERVAFGL
jgi:hypothetical protein